MSSHLNRGRDLAGWLAAAGVAAMLLAGAAVAALRSPPGMTGAGQEEAVALDLSVGVVPLSAVLPSAPPEGVVATAPEMPEAPIVEDVPDPAPEVPRVDLAATVMPAPEMPAPVMELPQSEAPPVMAAAPPPPPEAPPEEPPLEMAQSPRPVARPNPEVRRAEAPAPKPEAVAELDPAPPAQAQAAQPAGSDQAARPAQERRVAGGQAAARYGDAVMRQIAKLRRHKAPERGVVTVGFEIAGDGGLRRVAVVSSSGSAALDQVAVDHIRRAAPFPPPPEGASLRFAFEFVGR